MARLTKQVKDGYFVLNCDACEMKGENCTPMGCLQVATKRLADYEETLLEPKEVAGLCAMDKRRHMAKMLRWEEAEQDGSLVVLPCKVGDHVWIDGRDAIVTEFFGYRSERYFHAVILGRNKHIDIPFDEIGKTIFLTREEAEAALKEADNA